MTPLQTVDRKTFRYKLDNPAMPESWNKQFVPMIETALPSLFEKDSPDRITKGRITKVSLLLSLEGGEIQPCHVDVDPGW